MASLQSFEQISDLAGATVPILLNVAAAILIFFVGKWVAEGLIRLLRLAMRRGRVDETLADFLANLLYGLAVAVIVMSALAQLGVNTTSAAAIFGGAALAIGLSLQSQLSSLAAGVIIILFRPFRKGDFVEISGVKGVVEEIKIISTQLRTIDNRELIVPNSSVTTNIITNYTARATRRLDLVIAIAHDADLQKAKRAIQEVTTAEARVLKSPAPTVGVKALTETAVEILASPWVRTGEIGEVEPALLEAIKLRFDAEGVALARAPYPRPR
jgi:small conductance mechanosensitive channel